VINPNLSTCSRSRLWRGLRQLWPSSICVTVNRIKPLIEISDRLQKPNLPYNPRIGLPVAFSIPSQAWDTKRLEHLDLLHRPDLLGSSLSCFWDVGCSYLSSQMIVIANWEEMKWIPRRQRCITILFCRKILSPSEFWHLHLRDYLGTKVINRNVAKEDSIWWKLTITKIRENFENIREIFQKSAKFGILKTAISRKGMNKSLRILDETSWFYIVNN
jgi:hypothetical protein